MKRTECMEHKEVMEHIFHRIESNESNVTIIETRDPIRVEMTKMSLLEKLQNDAQKFEKNQKKKQPTQLINFDMFEGMSICEKVKESIIEKAILDEDLKRDIREGGLQAFIEHADNTLKAKNKEGNMGFADKRTFITLTGVRNEYDIELLDSALYNWSLAQKIWDVAMNVEGSGIHIKNHVFVFVPAMSLIPENTLNRCISVSPPLSTYKEREAEFLKKRDIFKDIISLTITPAIVNASAALNLHQVETSFYLCLKRYGIEKKTNPNADPLSLAVLKDIKKEMIEKSGILKVEDTQFGFERVGGYNEVIQYIRESIINPLKFPEEAERYGVEIPRGIILAGPPGTGKSLFSKTMAYELDLNLLSLHYPSVMSEYVGRAEKNLAQAIKQAEESAPCLLGIEEIDFLGDRKSGASETTSGGGDTTGRMFSQLLEYLGREDRKATLIATTNMPEKLDEAFIRSGRVDVIIPMLYPDKEARAKIFEVHTKVKRNIPIEEERYEEIRDDVAAQTKMFAGADIEELAKRAARLAYIEKAKSVTKEHFSEALNMFNVDVADREKKEKEFLSKAKKLCSDRRFLKEIQRREKILSNKPWSNTRSDSFLEEFGNSR